MIPYTLVLKPGLVIYSVYNGYWFWGRPSFEDLRRDLREVTREIRPDWDLAAPGLRAAWEAGDHSLHHPYQQADHMRTVTPIPVQMSRAASQVRMNMATITKPTVLRLKRDSKPENPRAASWRSSSASSYSPRRIEAKTRTIRARITRFSSPIRSRKDADTTVPNKPPKRSRPEPHAAGSVSRRHHPRVNAQRPKPGLQARAPARVSTGATGLPGGRP
jgi:hypothetical protein